MPSQKSFAVFMALAIAMVIWGLIPVPSLDELKTESATMEKGPPNAGSIWFKTESGQDVSCSGGRHGICSTSEILELRRVNASVNVWHDGNTVYQIESLGKYLLTPAEYQKKRYEQCFLAALFFCLLAIGLGFVQNLRRNAAN